jgi:predicted oxidoreductase
MRWILLILLIVFVSCKKDSDGFTIYTVKANNERCAHWPNVFHGKNALDFWFKTNSTWLWTDSTSYHSHSGWAKIAGLSDGSHRNNSYRLGYKCEYGVMVVALFVERGSRYLSEILDTLQVNSTYHCRLAREGGYYVARINGKEARIEAGKDRKLGYKLFPCMAGSFTLNHNWTVPVKWD